MLIYCPIVLSLEQNSVCLDWSILEPVNSPQNPAVKLIPNRCDCPLQTGQVGQGQSLCYYQVTYSHHQENSVQFPRHDRLLQELLLQFLLSASTAFKVSSRSKAMYSPLLIHPEPFNWRLMPALLELAQFFCRRMQMGSITQCVTFHIILAAIQASNQIFYY